jgi:hypothetical protein
MSQSLITQKMKDNPELAEKCTRFADGIPDECFYPELECKVCQLKPACDAREGLLQVLDKLQGYV